MDEQSKAAGFYQEALDHVARQGYGNASFEVGGEEGLDIVEEFYTDESKSEQYQQTHDLTHVQDIQKGLQQSVQALNYWVEAGRFFLQRALLFERNRARIIDWEKNIMNAFTGQTFQIHQLISIKQVVEYTGLSRSTVYDIMNEKSRTTILLFQRKLK
jgi:hypothetical protein